MLPGVILAAGESRRMGTPKPLLLTPDARTFVAAIATTLAEAGIRDITVVTGRDHSLIEGALSHLHLPVTPRLVRNPDPSRGQFSSLLTGLDAAAGPETQGIVVTLVDIPLVMPQTVRLVLTEWARTRAPIVRPAIGDRHGHPVVFDQRVFADLRAASPDVGAKAVIRMYEKELLNVPVLDTGCLVDVDTPGDYQALTR